MTLDMRPSTWNPRPSTSDPRFLTLDLSPSTITQTRIFGVCLHYQMLTRTVNTGGGGNYHKEDGELVKERLIYGKLGGGASIMTGNKGASIMEQMKKSSHCNHLHVKGAHLKTGNFVYSSGIKINFWV